MRGLLLTLAAIASLACSRGGQHEIILEPTSPLEILGSEGGVSMARVRLGPSETFRFEASPCQEMLVLVERGTVRASMLWVESGRAARFRTPTLVQAMSREGAEIFAVAALSGNAPIDTIDWESAPLDQVCPSGMEALIVSDPERVGPFVRARGRLSVMIYLDGDAGGPPVVSLGSLDGAATLTVPEHVHETSGEVLWIQDGSGTMRVGKEMRRIQPGTFVYVPPRTVHGFVPDGTRRLFAYQVYTPSGPEQRFR